MLDINTNEYVWLIGKHSSGSSTFKVKFPKVMPTTKTDKPTVTPVNVNINFLNDASCKPNPAKIVKKQNYITIGRASGLDLSDIAIKGTVPHYKRLLTRVTHKVLFKDNMKVIGH